MHGVSTIALYYNGVVVVLCCCNAIVIPLKTNTFEKSLHFMF